MTRFIPGGPPRYHHQRRGLAKVLATKGVCALLFEPGAGKTAVALDFASILALKKGTARVLVIAPLAAIDTWVLQSVDYVSPQVGFYAEALGGTILQRAEALASRGGREFQSTKRRARVSKIERETGMAHRHRSLAYAERVEPGKPRLELVTVNLDTFSSRQARGSSTMADKVLDGIKRFDPHLVILDESHKIKSPTGNASRLLSRVGDTVDHRLILTGTVMPHGPLDVFAQWRFLEPYAFGSDGHRATFGEFESRYARLGGWMGKEVLGYKDLDHMRDIMALNSISVTKEEALDLPPSQEVIVPVHLSPRERKAYDDLKESLVTTLDLREEVRVPNRLTQMLRLRQVTSGHLPTADGEVVTLGHSKADTIASVVNDTLIGEDRVVVFVFFKHEVEALAQRLRVKGTTVETITGATHGDERLAIRQRFGNREAHPERIVLVAQIRTISLAVNELVTACHAVFGSLSQQRDDYVQARDRLTRIGQTRPVTFWIVQVPKSVDSVIHQSIKNRTDLERALLQHLKEAS